MYVRKGRVQETRRMGSFVRNEVFYTNLRLFVLFFTVFVGKVILIQPQVLRKFSPLFPPLLASSSRYREVESGHTLLLMREHQARLVFQSN